MAQALTTSQAELLTVLYESEEIRRLLFRKRQDPSVMPIRCQKLLHKRETGTASPVYPAGIGALSDRVGCLCAPDALSRQVLSCRARCSVPVRPAGTAAERSPPLHSRH